MAVIPKYVSNTQKDFKIGVGNYSEDKLSLKIIGNVGIGTTSFEDPVSIANTAKLAVGIATAYNIFADHYHGDENNNFYAGPFVGSSSTETTLNIGIGQSSGTSLTTGKNNILLGNCVGAVEGETEGEIVGFEAVGVVVGDFVGFIIHP